MFLHLAHTQLPVYRDALQLVVVCYEILKKFPAEERYILSQQIKRASLSVYLNIAEGCSRKSEKERKRYFEIARGSVVEVDAGFDVAISLCYTQGKDLTEIGHIVTYVY